MDMGIYYARADITTAKINHLCSGNCPFAGTIVRQGIIEHICYYAVPNKNPPFKGETFTYYDSILKQILSHIRPVVLIYAS